MKIVVFLLLALGLCLDSEKGMTLSQARDLRMELFTCDVDPRYFDFAITEVSKWLEVVEHAEQLASDIEVLRRVFRLVEKAKVGFAFIQTQLTLSSEYAKCRVSELLKYMEQMQA